MITPDISQRAKEMRFSLIRTIAEKGMGKENVIPLWFGEGCWPTSSRAVQAVHEALAKNDHFYHPNSGKTSLRQALARYQQNLYQRPLTAQNITVTASGMQALALASQAIINHGDKVIYVDPVWPNLPEVFKIAGAQTHAVSLQAVNGKWQLDIEKLCAQLTPDHRAVMVNSPNNPTGWVMSEAEIQFLLEHCRRHDIWIISDDVYARLYPHGPVAPSFQHFAEEEDKILSINSFSKAWSMTGWRLGWIVAPASLEASLANLTEFNIACPAGFIQAAGEAMITSGEAEIAQLKQRLATGYDIVSRGLKEINSISFIEPQGAFYVLFGVEGYADSVALAMKLLDEAEVGLAPGGAFGPSAEGHLRLCYAQEPEILHEAIARIKSLLHGN